MDETGTTSKLPRGPWRTVREKGDTPEAVIRFDDADGAIVLRATEYDSPLVVLRAIKALPLLVEAARTVITARDAPIPPGGRSIRPTVEAMHALRAVLNQIDGRENV